VCAANTLSEKSNTAHHKAWAPRAPCGEGVVSVKYRCKNCCRGYSSKNEDHQRCECGLILELELIPENRGCQHFWLGCDDLVFISGENKGSSADVHCEQCDMGAFTDEQGNVIPHSISEVGFQKD
jgi:hypothetical protein